MPRDPRETIAKLEAKAADPAVTGPERDALLSKVSELRAKLPTVDHDDLEAEAQRAVDEWYRIYGGGFLIRTGQGANVTTTTSTHGWVRWNGKF